MTVLTDVPESGIYMQRGAIVQLIVQMLDYTTKQPIQLQTATGLSISVAYPDGVTFQTFEAHLYTDGSDGQIYYTTQNDGSTVDLFETGLYHFQGNAVVGGVYVPPSYQDDFYVLPNAMGVPSVVTYPPSVLVLSDPAGIRWGMTVNTSGTISAPVLLSNLPTNSLWFESLYMKDSNGVTWSVMVSTMGVLTTTVVTSQIDSALNSLILNDSGGRAWVVTISTDGVLGAA